MNTTIIEARGLRIHTRPGTLDEYVVRENLGKRVSAYLRGTELTPDDVWLDIGAHIGTFALSVAAQVDHVHCFEPDPENRELLLANIDENRIPNVSVHPEAVADVDCPVELYRNQKRNTGAHSLFVKRGRGEPVVVQGLGIQGVLDEIRPTKVKMDCEGAESIIIPAVTDWLSAHELHMEYHFAALKDKDHAGLNMLMLALSNRGFKRIAAEGATERAWLGMVHAWR